MYIRGTKVRRKDGSVDEYLRLVESFRDQGGKVRHHIVCNIGRKELLAPFADSLVAALKGEPRKQTGGEEVAAWDWGVFLAVRHIWQELGIEEILDGLDGGGKNRGEFSDRALVLIANRFCNPTSEHGLARWLETDYVCNRKGERYLPQWRDDAERLRSKLPRVRVRPGQLQQWYRTLDKLLEHKERIEEQVFIRLRTLFSIKVDLVFFDITSTYFEGHGPAKLGKHGHSRDGKPRNRQVVVGVLMVDGWPIAHYAFPGNRRDSTTVQEVIRNAQKRFGLRRIIFVGDRGMVTCDNLEFLVNEGHGYLVGLQRRKREEVIDYINRATGRWQRCPMGIAAQEKSVPPETLVQEVSSNEPGVRVFVVHSDERMEYEQAQREKCMRLVKDDLEALKRRVEKGQLKSPEKIGAAAQSALNRHHGCRYFDWKLEQGRFSFFEHPVNLVREKAIEGKYIIQTQEANLSPVQAVEIYKELNEVERGFRSVKDIIEMRPIFHKTDQRVEAHIFVAALALLIHRAIEKRLKGAGLDFSTDEACNILKTVRLVEFLDNEKTKRVSVTNGSARAPAIINALAIKSKSPL